MILTETMWPMAESTPSAPKRAPTSEPRPQACRHTAPREWRAGFPPEVNDDKQESATKIGWDLLEATATRLSANPSTARDMEARYLSKFNSEAMSWALGSLPGELVDLGFRRDRMTENKHQWGLIGRFVRTFVLGRKTNKLKALDIQSVDI